MLNNPKISYAPKLVGKPKTAPAKTVNTADWQARTARATKGSCGHSNCNGSCGCK